MNYPGGKNGAGVYQTIINQMPPHLCYVEPFVGSGAVMRHKRPAETNIAIDKDPNVAQLWRDAENVSFSVGCGIDWLERHGPSLDADSLVYCDPTYLMETRRSQRDLYRFEMSRQDHERLLTIIARLPCRVMISGYWSRLYAEALDRRWRTVEYQSMTRGGGLATEHLWLNFGPPAALHDYRYLGQDYRERERIKKKVKRWAARLAKQPELEAQALLSALYEVQQTRHHQP